MDAARGATTHRCSPPVARRCPCGRLSIVTRRRRASRLLRLAVLERRGRPDAGAPRPSPRLASPRYRALIASGSYADPSIHVAPALRGAGECAVVRPRHGDKRRGDRGPRRARTATVTIKVPPRPPEDMSHRSDDSMVHGPGRAREGGRVRRDVTWKSRLRTARDELSAADTTVIRRERRCAACSVDGQLCDRGTVFDFYFQRVARQCRADGAAYAPDPRERARVVHGRAASTWRLEELAAPDRDASHEVPNRGHPYRLRPPRRVRDFESGTPKIFQPW